MNPLVCISPGNNLPEAEYRKWIVEIEGKIQASGETYDRHTVGGPCELEHVFTDGLYTRTIFIPAGQLIISKIHLYEHPFVISQGRVSVYDGSEVVEITAPYRGVTKPGTKRILFTHEDTLWSTFHITDKKKLEDVDINGILTCESYEQFDQLIEEAGK